MNHGSMDHTMPMDDTMPAGHDMPSGGHDRHEGHSVAMFRDKFWLTLALTVPVVLLSKDIQAWVGYSIPAIPGSCSCAARERSWPTGRPG